MDHLASQPALRYDRTTIVLHWAIAFAVALQWCDAHTIDWFPKGSLRTDVRSFHIVGGWLLTLAVVYRAWWRLNRGTVFQAVGPSSWRAASRTLHGLLYLLLAGVLLLGLAGSLIRGDDIFGFFHLPQLVAPNAPDPPPHHRSAPPGCQRAPRPCGHSCCSRTFPSLCSARRRPNQNDEIEPIIGDRPRGGGREIPFAPLGNGFVNSSFDH